MQHPHLLTIILYSFFFFFFFLLFKNPNLPVVLHINAPVAEQTLDLKDCGTI